MLFTALAFFVLRLVVLRRESLPDARPLRHPLAAFAAGLAGGALLAAVRFVPLAELILHSGELDERAAADPDKISLNYLAWRSSPTTGAGPPGPCCPSSGSSTPARSMPGRCR